MDLGEKLRQARLEAGLSQRQLCGETITRNMLSQIENGSARPSMKTLHYLSSRLGKPISYFLEETALVSPNQETMAAARQAYDHAAYAAAAEILDSYRKPDPVYDREMELLYVLTHLALAEQALDQHREVYAQALLNKANLETTYLSEALHRRRLLLLSRIQGQKVSAYLPSLDEELLVRAREALSEDHVLRAARLLDAAGDQTAPVWNLLRGQAFLREKSWHAAAQCLHLAESAYPKETAPQLEQCYRELQDYKRAYEYACKQK